MKAQITEICLTDGRDIEPFAVIVESVGECAWSIAADPRQERDREWPGHVLAAKGRRASEWWTLDAWQSWLEEVAQEPLERRREALRRLDALTPGILVKNPRTAYTRLPPGAVAKQWRRRRLHDRSEVIAAEIASRLARNGSAHWSSALFAEGHEPLQGDWVIVHQRSHDASIQTDRQSSSVFGYLLRGPEPPSEVGADNMLVVVRIIDQDQMDVVLKEWVTARETMGAAAPFGLAVVRGQRFARMFDGIAIIGERFAAPVLLAVAAIRAHATAHNYSGRSGESDD